MQNKLSKIAEQQPKSAAIKNINAIQRMQLEQILKYSFQAIAVFDFDDTSETYETGLADKSKALTSFQMIFAQNISNPAKSSLVGWGIWDSVQEVRKILFHPNPHGASSGAAGGLLNLVRYDDAITPHITKEAVVQYIQLEVERRIDCLLAQGIEPAVLALDLRSQIGRIENNSIRAIFLGKIDACKKLINTKHVSFDDLYELGKSSGSALEYLLENVDAAIYLIENKHFTFKQISAFGIKNFIALEYLLEHKTAYISYVARGLTTFDKLFALVTNRYTKEAFKAFGEYSDAVEKLLKLGISFDDLYELGKSSDFALEYLLPNVDAAIYLIENKHLTFKQISAFGIQSFVALSYLLEHHTAYISYVARGLTTFDELFALVLNLHLDEAFKAFGEHNKSVEKLLKLGISFDDLYELGKSDGYALSDLLNNVDAAIYLIENKHFTFKQISAFGIKNFIALEYLLEHKTAYISYVARGLTTFDKLFALVPNFHIDKAFKAFGKHNKSVEKLLKLGISFDDLYELGKSCEFALQCLLKNVDAAKSQKWIRDTLVEKIEQQEVGSKFLEEVEKLQDSQKKNLCIQNGLLLLNFIENNNNFEIDSVLKLPLTVLKNFDNSKDSNVLSIALNNIEKMKQLMINVADHCSRNC